MTVQLRSGGKLSGADVPEDDAEMAELEATVVSAVTPALELFLPRQRKAPG